ncbi:MAG: sulfite exporter TauE/SafE family protein [Aquificota bacterium]|nr:sulfite exporter TauE/SafE family protein [Aquificota bacterium]
MRLPGLNPFKGAVSGSLALGTAYSFSLCPSCTSLLAGAFVLAASTGNPLEGATLMAVYAAGRSVPIFLSGTVVGSLGDFIRSKQILINRAVGLIFLAISGYLYKNFLEAVL